MALLCYNDHQDWGMQSVASMSEHEAHRTEALFVYGTLMPASGRPMARRLASESRYLGPGSIAGKLYHLGSHPGAVFSDRPRDIIYGDVIRLLRPRWSFAWLDQYEGCGPGKAEPHAYQRVIVPVQLRSGARLDAWVYVYKHPVRGGRHIPYGRFSRNSPMRRAAPLANAMSPLMSHK